MQTQDKVQAIEAKIRATCPGLQELSFGCEVEIPRSKNKAQQGKQGRGVVTKSYIGQLSSWSGYDRKKDAISVYMRDTDVYRPCISVGKNKISIIGHPIELSHLLRTLNAISPPELVEFCENLWRTNVQDSRDMEAYEELPDYDIRLSFTDNMKDENLVEWLYSIICEHE